MLKNQNSPAASQNLPSDNDVNIDVVSPVNEGKTAFANDVPSSVGIRTTTRRKPTPAGDDNVIVPFPLAFIQFTRQLGNMYEWFGHYKDRIPDDDEYQHKYQRIQADDIQTYLCDAVSCITTLAGCEFQDTMFWNKIKKRPETNAG